MAYRMDRTGLAERIDRGPPVAIGATPVEVTPDGFKVYEGTATIGDVVLDYPEYGRAEFRPAEEVASDAALESLVGKPFTGGPRDPETGELAADHPPQLITPDTAGDLTEGVVLRAWREPDPATGRVRARVRVIAYTRAIQDLIESGVVELSPGYRCKEDPTPGVHDGRPYAVVQRGHLYNHLNVVLRARTRTPEGDVARLDSDDKPASYHGSETGMKIQDLLLALMKARKDGQPLPEPVKAELAKVLQTRKDGAVALSEDDLAKLTALSPEGQAVIAQLLGPPAAPPIAVDDAGGGALSPAMKSAIDAYMADKMRGDAPTQPGAGDAGGRKDGQPGKPAAGGDDKDKPQQRQDAGGIDMAAVLKRSEELTATTVTQTMDRNAGLVAAVRADGHANVFGPTEAVAVMLATVKQELPDLAPLAEAEAKAGRFDSLKTLFGQAGKLRKDRLVREQLEDVLGAVRGDSDTNNAGGVSGDDFMMPAGATG